MESTSANDCRAIVLEQLTHDLAMKWNKLAHEAGNFYLSVEWLAFIAGQQGVRSAHCCVLDVNGDLLAAFPVSRNESEDNDLYQPSEVFSGMRGDWNGIDGYLGARNGYTNDILLTHGMPDQQEDRVLAAAFDAAVRWVNEKGSAGAFAWHLGESQARMLHSRGLVSSPMLSCHIAELEISGRTVDDYVSTLPRKRAQEVRREMRQARRAGLEFAVEALAQACDEGGPLIAQTMRRYGHDWTGERGVRSLRRHAGAFGDTAVVFTCRREGKLLGLCVAYAWGGALLVRMVGLDYAELVGAYEYFNVAYYEPIDYAARNGIGRVIFGTGSLPAKTNRGARLVSRWTCVAPGRLGPDGNEVAEWNDRRIGPAATD
ncbi:GNAT family N-acetyltransferase [Actinoplanes sp. NPDC049596]|uniref:GNAT family N-acetyltransferase n=1 Tax=unclassified Actinoplanes TaxID=2626549 RepID=UPI003421D106